MNLGEGARKIRMLRGWAQKVVAINAGLTQGYVSTVENRMLNLNNLTLQYLSKGLQVPVHYLIIMGIDDNLVPDEEKEFVAAMKRHVITKIESE